MSRLSVRWRAGALALLALAAAAGWWSGQGGGYVCEHESGETDEVIVMRRAARQGEPLAPSMVERGVAPLMFLPPAPLRSEGGLRPLWGGALRRDMRRGEPLQPGDAEAEAGGLKARRGL